MQSLIRVGLSLTMAAGAVIVVLAQDPATPSQPGSAMSARTVTAVGCLKQGKDVTSAPADAARPAPAATDFVLTDAKITPGGAASSTSTTTSSSSSTAGTTSSSTTSSAPASPAAAPGMMFKITGVDDANLTPHLNHQVEITGRIEGGAASSSSSASSSTTTRETSPTTGSTTTRTDQTQMAMRSLQTINATAVKMLSATCTRSGT